MAQYKIMIKQWVETERSHGHSVDVTDLILQWSWYAEEVAKQLEGRELEPADRIFPEFHWDWLGEIITETRETIRETIRETMQETVRGRPYGGPYGRPETIRETITTGVHSRDTGGHHGRETIRADHTGDLSESGFGSTRRAVRFHPNRSSGDRFCSKVAVQRIFP